MSKKNSAIDHVFVAVFSFDSRRRPFPISSKDDQENTVEIFRVLGPRWYGTFPEKVVDLDFINSRNFIAIE